VPLSLGSESDRPFIKTVTIGSDVSFSLETDDRLIAESRKANALDHLRRRFELTEADPVSLSHRHLVALSGGTYLLYQEIHGEPSARSYHKALHRAALEGRIKNPPPAALTPNAADAASELFGDGDLTEAANALPASLSIYRNRNSAQTKADNQRPT
jgi:hypothetical protein